MTSPIFASLTKDHVLRALAELAARQDVPLVEPSDAALLHDDHRYSPSEVAARAIRHATGQAVSDDLLTGELAEQAIAVLRSLGFTISEPEAVEADSPAGTTWTSAEVQLLVADYFDMLTAELTGRAFKKSDHFKALMLRLPGRTKGSIEYKHQNLSRVLLEFGLPYIRGYAPMSNYQSLLAAEVESFLTARPDIFRDVLESPSMNPQEAKSSSGRALDEILVLPPEPLLRISSQPITKPWQTRRTSRIDFAERDARNRRLGQLGEQFMFDLERRRLNELGRDDLAKKVVWASREIGDGLGFDIVSWDATDETEKLLEVKATVHGEHFPFYVTANELRCSEDVPTQYRLCRVFDFAATPRVFFLNGPLTQTCRLDPVAYRATL